ncbi:outer membrane lipoprotein carrier protein LolA [beta proteobacterium KB13]|uniref:Outer-membrane lipoprotein carrier protein n=1 Tax=beta proteobacterium KB13 TaxID=314607 RepID=B6BUC4_9PROT|nr:outer membrane lipoprotein carrier protein LolA [beta proteobacterium KB13]
MLLFYLNINLLWAAPADELSSLLNKTIAFSGQFSQSVYDNKSQLIEEANGEVVFKKPHFFKWIYQAPHQNQIIGDGETVYIYDPDLSQVIMSKFSQSKNNNPANIFFLNNIEEYFKVTKILIEDEIWYRCESKSKDIDYQSIEISFNEDKIHGMRVVDSLQNKIIINFLNILQNRNIDEASFLFNVPDNVEVIRN